MPRRRILAHPASAGYFPRVALDFAVVRADNPGPFSLTGTNTYLVGSGPCWCLDPGPDLDPHVEAVAAEAARRGGLAGIVITHDHHDHTGAVAELRAATGQPPVHAAKYPADVPIGDGDRVGPFDVVATPGHSPDHLAYIADGVCFSGDAVLGTGSVFVAPDPGSLRGYLDALARLRALPLELIAPGHGPLVEDPAAKLDEYVEHRLDRERRLIEALASGKRTVDELLDDVWSDAPPVLRPAAAVTLAAHLDKLEEEGRLPDGVERPPWDPSWGALA
jgi:glyoxylase-like metal-dependent hydrolase (beta-lactamase superfamily II)